MLDQQSQADKCLRALHRELKKLRRRSLTPPVHELKPPIQRGWKRHFVMTSAARERPDAAALETILAALNTVQHFWRPDFRYSRRQSVRRKVVSIEQPLAALHREELEQEPIVAGWRKYFRSNSCRVIPSGVSGAGV